LAREPFLIGSTWSDWSDWLNRIDRIVSIGSNRVQKLMIFAIFGLIWTQFRSKQLKIWPGSHFWSNQLDRINRIDSIGVKNGFLVEFFENTVYSRESRVSWLFSYLLRKITANTKISNLYRVKFKYGKKLFHLSGKWKIRKKFLSHCLCYHKKFSSLLSCRPTAYQSMST